MSDEAPSSNGKLTTLLDYWTKQFMRELDQFHKAHEALRAEHDRKFEAMRAEFSSRLENLAERVYSKLDEVKDASTDNRVSMVDVKATARTSGRWAGAVISAAIAILGILVSVGVALASMGH